MSKKLTEEEKLQRQFRRDEKAVEKEVHPQVDKYGAKILRILREEAPDNPDIKYNSEYFEKRFEVSNITVLRAAKKLKANNLIKEKQVHGSYAIEEKFTEEFYSQHCSEEIKKNVALIASLGGLLQQYKNTPLYDSVKDLIYFLQPEIAKSDKIFSSGRVIVSPQMEYDINIQNWESVIVASDKLPLSTNSSRPSSNKLCDSSIIFFATLRRTLPSYKSAIVEFKLDSLHSKTS